MAKKPADTVSEPGVRPALAADKKTKLLSQAVADVRAFCSQNADPAIVTKYAKYFKEGYDGYGISREIWEEKNGLIFDRYSPHLNLGDFFDLGDLLFESGKYEEGSFAIVSVKRLLSFLKPESVQRIGGWLESGVRNWAHSDVICGELLSPCLKKGLITAKDLAGWLESSSKWKRRAVPVALLALIKNAPTEDLLDFIRPLMLDPERVVHQGLGWFLREAWKKDPEPVEKFLFEWKDSAARLIFQYATEKMTPDQKGRFRKAKA